MDTNPQASTLNVRTVWISDLHLGTPGCQATALLAFLRDTECDTLYLVGDIIDGWQLRRSWYWPQSHNDVVQKILRKARKGTRVVFVPGNHDEFARRYVANNFGGVDIVEDCVHLTADGRRLWVTHGDLFDGVIQCAKWLAYVGDVAYEFTLKVNRSFNVARARLGLPYWSLSRFLKAKVKRAVSYVSDFEAAVAREARSRGLDGVVCGHIHQAEMREIEGVLYCNDGDWVESLTALVEHHDGRLEIIDHSARARPVVQAVQRSAEPELQPDLQPALQPARQSTEGTALARTTALPARLDTRPEARLQSAAEEKANSLSHGVGLLLALAALPVLLQASQASVGRAAHLAAVSVFAATMILLYLSSALFHGLPPGRGKHLFGKLDHAAIYLFIAGSYSPFAAITLQDHRASLLLGLVWLLAVAGALVTVLEWVRKPLWSTAMYVALGWLVLVAALPALEQVSATGMKLLVAGGVVYTAGAVLFLLGARLRFAHLVWHLFVMAGSGLHVAAVLKAS